MCILPPENQLKLFSGIVSKHAEQDEFRKMLVSNSTDSSVKKCLSLETKQTFEGITTERLHLRAWKDGDIEKIHLIMQDPDVNHYLQHHKLNERATIERLVEKSKQNIIEHGYGYFVCEHKETGEVMGMVGLNYVEVDAPYFPCYTVSWIFGKPFWGKGHATEAAKALIKYGFEVCNLSEIYACTTSENKASENVMKRLGMSFKNNFGFPGFKEDDPLYKHVLYVQEKNGGYLESSRGMKKELT